MHSETRVASCLLLSSDCGVYALNTTVLTRRSHLILGWEGISYLPLVHGNHYLQPGATRPWWSLRSKNLMCKLWYRLSCNIQGGLLCGLLCGLGHRRLWRRWNGCGKSHSSHSKEIPIESAMKPAATSPFSLNRFSHSSLTTGLIHPYMHWHCHKQAEIPLS